MPWFTGLVYNLDELVKKLITFQQKKNCLIKNNGKLIILRV